MEMLIRAICLVGGYGVGLIQTAYIYGRIKGVDIRKYGSGNAGTTNALRVLGKKAGLIVFLGDFLKGIIACSLTHIILGQLGIGNAYMFVLYTGLGVVLGHNFPFYMQFKGGKGIAASGGVILLAAFVISVVITRYVSVGSLTIMIGFFILYTVFAIHGDYNFTSNAKMIEGIIMAGIIAGMAVIRHWQNIKRLIAGTENKLSFGSKKA